MLESPDYFFRVREIGRLRQTTTHNGGEPLAPGKSRIDFHSHRECMEEDHEYANELGKQGGKNPRKIPKFSIIIIIIIIVKQQVHKKTQSQLYDLKRCYNAILRTLVNVYTIEKQRCRDRVINDFLSWSRHLLVPLLFHELTSLHPPSFQRNDFSTCSTYFFIWGRTPIEMQM